MNLFRRIGIFLSIYQITQQDVAQGIQQKNTNFLKVVLQRGAYPERVSAALGLGQIKARNSVPYLLPLLWDDFESVSFAARRSLTQFLPNQQIEKALKKADAYWTYKKERSLKRNTSSDDSNNQFKTPSLLIDRSQMKRLERVKNQLRKSIRLW